MKKDVYELEFAEDLSSFDFVSIGKNGRIRKRILFSPMETDDMYSLLFGDVTETDRVNDRVVSDNGDRNKILATIMLAIDRYTARYPNRAIYFMASSEARTRLYRIAISLRLEELSSRYSIYADLDSEDDWVLFQKNMEIKAFLVMRKTFYHLF